MIAHPGFQLLRLDSALPRQGYLPLDLVPLWTERQTETMKCVSPGWGWGVPYQECLKGRIAKMSSFTSWCPGLEAVTSSWVGQGKAF